MLKYLFMVSIIFFTHMFFSLPKPGENFTAVTAISLDWTWELRQLWVERHRFSCLKFVVGCFLQQEICRITTILTTRVAAAGNKPSNPYYLQGFVVLTNPTILGSRL